MKMELQILDWIQQMRTPVGDVWMVFISRLGNAGMIWILFAYDSADEKMGSCAGGSALSGCDHL